MKICIDARWIFSELSGIGTYTQELIRHLVQIDNNNDYLILFNDINVLERTKVAAQLHGLSNVQCKLLDYGVFSPMSQFKLPKLLKALKVELYHSTNYMIPFLAFPKHRIGTIRCAVTIHDLIPLIFPDHAPKSKKRRLFPLFKKIMYEAGARADLIITPSTSSKNDVIEHLRLPQDDCDKVYAIPEGVAKKFKPSGNPKSKPPTVLYVGRSDPYKNVVRLVEAFAQVRKTTVPDLRLRIIGPKDPRYPQAGAKALGLGIAGHVEWSGYVSETELIHAYQDATVLVLPSDYEGFGLPVLEAMASGTPVICSRSSSLPEVAGSAAILIDPHQPGQLEDGLNQILTNEDFAKDLIHLGLEHAKEFTWKRTAKMTLEAYEITLEK